MAPDKGKGKGKRKAEPSSSSSSSSRGAVAAAVRRSRYQTRGGDAGAGPSNAPAPRYPRRVRRAPSFVPHRRDLESPMIDWRNVHVPRHGPPPESRVPALKTLAEAALGRRVPSLKALAADKATFPAQRPAPRLQPRTHSMRDFEQLYNNQHPQNAWGPVTGEPLDPALFIRLMLEASDVHDDDFYYVPVVYDTVQPRPHHTRESSSSSSSSSGPRRRSANMRVVPVTRRFTKGPQRRRRK